MKPDTDDIVRLYTKEWVVVTTIYKIAADARPLFDEAQEWITENLRGRVREDDIRLTMFTDQGSVFWCNIEIFKDNLKGEFKQHAYAEMQATINKYDEYTIVPRNSAADHEIRNYGVTKLDD